VIIMFDLSKASFEQCNIQMNEGDGQQINDSISEQSVSDIKKICSELESIALENEKVRTTIQEIKNEIEGRKSKSIIRTLLETLKSTILSSSIYGKFPQIVKNVGSMIENFLER